MSSMGNRGGSFPEHQRSGSTSTRPSTGPDAGSGSQGVVSSVKDKAQELQSTAADYAGQAKEKAQEFISTAANRAEDAWETTKHQVEAFGTRARDTAEDAWENVNTFIRQHPMPSVLCAVGFGFVLAQAMQFMMWGGRQNMGSRSY